MRVPMVTSKMSTVIEVNNINNTMQKHDPVCFFLCFNMVNIFTPIHRYPNIFQGVFFLTVSITNACVCTNLQEVQNW